MRLEAKVHYPLEEGEEGRLSSRKFAAQKTMFLSQNLERC